MVKECGNGSGEAERGAGEGNGEGGGKRAMIDEGEKVTGE